MNALPIYQRAVTPTASESNTVRGKALSYQSAQLVSQSFKAVLDSNDVSSPSHALQKEERDEDNEGGTIFSTKSSSAGEIAKLVVYRSSEERQRNPERLNLDRRGLEACPLLEKEEHLRLLNYQNNNIKVISNLENLPQLIFIDFYNNNLRTLEGPLSCVKGLRVLMAGKNKISLISNLTSLRKLDVLDLHSNEISDIQGLDMLTELRVLNLAGNKISTMQNLSHLSSLTELNLRRNSIEQVSELEALPALQRVFLSHNFISSFSHIRCLLNAKNLLELSLDGNPLSDGDLIGYRCRIIGNMPKLMHLDLKPITAGERALSLSPAAREEINENEKMAKIAAIADHVDVKIPETKAMPSSGTTGTLRAGTVGLNPPPNPTPYPAQWGSFTSPLQPHIDTSLNPHSTKAISRSPHIYHDMALDHQKRFIAAEGKAWRWSWSVTESESLLWLAGVRELTAKDMCADAVSTEISSKASYLTGLVSIALSGNDVSSLLEVSSILVSFHRLEYLTIRDNPICLCQSGATPTPGDRDPLRSCVINLLPNLKFFNDIVISAEERIQANLLLRPFSSEDKDIPDSQQNFPINQIPRVVRKVEMEVPLVETDPPLSPSSNSLQTTEIAGDKCMCQSMYYM